MAAPAAAQPATPSNNPFTGQPGYGSANIVGPQDPDKSWLQPGVKGLLFESNDFLNHDGMVGVVNTGGTIQTEGHPFFDALGSNGRGCVSCHQPSQAMSLAAGNVRQRWEDSQGHLLDPVFAAVDGSDCPILPQTEKTSHGIVINRAAFRISLPWPPKDGAGKPITPDFTIAVAADPNGCNSGTYGPQAEAPSISVYRRPRMVANFPQVPGQGCGEDVKMAAIMADGREATLKSQAIDASLSHLELHTAPNGKQLKQIVDFECQVFSAQSFDKLNWVIVRDDTAPGLGPQSLALATKISSYLKSAGDGGEVFHSFNAWKASTGESVGGSTMEANFRHSVARGAELFSDRRFDITGAVGVNTSAAPVSGTCASCHDLTMSGMASAHWIDTGSTNQPWAIAAADLPLFKITCNPNAPPHPFLGRVIYTQDPGRALVTGKCADVGAITVQQLRGLSARAPYFSNGSAKTLGDVVDFYDRRFTAGFTPVEKQDLVNFLSVL
jgi:cytochrome c peroxidase